jgi:hypothetical protein
MLKKMHVLDRLEGQHSSLMLLLMNYGLNVLTLDE